MEKIRITAIIISVIAAAVGMSIGLDTQNILLWALSTFWLGMISLAQLCTPEKKRRRGNCDAKHD